MATTVDEPKSSLDATVRVFDQFYNFDLVVNGNEYDIVYSYFYSLSNSKNIAKNFTSIIFRISNITGENAIKLLESLQGGSNLQSYALLIYYYNSIKSKTTLYGISNLPKPNYNVQRNIIA